MPAIQPIGFSVRTQKHGPARETQNHLQLAVLKLQRVSIAARRDLALNLF
jgi:hypothetical protein